MKQTRVNLGSFHHRRHGDSNNGKQRLQDKPSTSKQNKNTSPTRSKDHHHHQEDNFNLNPSRKQSVITKVREKAMKWRQFLAKKSQLDDHDYLQAPMYITENALTGMSQMDNQEEVDHLPSRVPAFGDDSKNPRPIRTSTNVHRREQYPPTTFHHNVKGKSSTSQRGIGFIIEEEKSVMIPNHSPFKNATKEDNSTNHTKTLAEAVTEKLAPACNGTIYELSIKDKTLSSVQEMNLSKPLTVTPSTSEDDNNVIDDDVAFGVYEESGLDKNVSFTEHVKDRMEPEEDEMALWEVIRKAILNPTMNIGDMGVMEKVKEVVSSLLQEEEEEEEEEVEDQEQEDEVEQQQLLQMNSTMHNTRSSSPLIPISTNAYEGEEESQKRILQTN